MAERKLEFIAAMLRSETAPPRTDVLWGKIVNPTQPEKVEVHYFSVEQGRWLPLRSPEFYANPVLERLDAPPATAAVGSRYLLSAEPTGTYAAYPHHIATREAAGWKFTAPRDGVSVPVLSEKRSYLAQGGTFTAMSGGPGEGSGAYFAELQGVPRNNAALATALDATRDQAVILLRDAVDSNYDTLAKLYALISSLQGTALKPPLAFDAAQATTFPTGSEDAGDTYLVSSSGTVQGVALNPQDFIFTSLPDAQPLPEDWEVIPGVAGLATDTVTGIVRLATTQEAETETSSAAMTAAQMAAWRQAVLGTDAGFDAYLTGAEVTPPTTLLDRIASRIAQQLQLQTSAAQIFVADVVATTSGKVVSKTLLPGTVGQTIVESVATNDDTIRLSLLIYGGTAWSPPYRANGEPISLTRLAGDHAFSGSVEVEINPAVEQIIITGNGGSVSLPVAQLGDAPAIQNVMFGSYPDGQTELKTGDQLLVTLEVESTTDLDKIVVADYGAFAAQVVSAQVLNATQAEVTLTVGHDHADPVAADLGVRLATRLLNGSQSEDFTVATGVLANNYAGQLSLTAVEYPTGQQAVKDSEVATLQLSYQDIDTLRVESLQFTVNDPEVLANTKTILLNRTGRDAGYKVSGSNVNLYGKRAANGAEINRTELVKIAHTPVDLEDNAVVTLRDDGSVTVNLTQDVLSLTVEDVPVGTLSSFSELSEDRYRAQLSIADQDARSNDTLSLELAAVNLAGIPATLQRSYRVKGFPQRQLTFTHPSLRQALPVEVTDAARFSIEGEINGAAPFPLRDMIRDAALDQVNKYDLQGGDVLLSSECENFGYASGTTITIRIEETV